MVSILKAAAAHKRLRALSVWLFFGGRGAADVPDPMQLLAGCENDFFQRICWHPAVSERPIESATQWSGDLGMVHSIVASKLSAPLRNYEFYLAGPPPMVEAALRLLIVEHKVPASQLHYDRFF